MKKKIRPKNVNFGFMSYQYNYECLDKIKHSDIDVKRRLYKEIDNEKKDKKTLF